ncbi:hypothetical protein F2P56_018262 [Juglans regia]|uniref:Protein FAR1-RELATED SEQUENCE n=2 Tax=Juglans regia TaxID=51240 RepID=A0A2I4DPG9_JUGRE|nr:protein FAR-RED ELONGATED HYPOCOTYL 3-like [Juglans regia]KAF5462239.1 hypothetical protein F2P56_018262 [Juglans regia]
MNAFFDGYVHARTNLKEFVDQFDNALRKKIENENAADFHSFNLTIPAVSISPLEKIFQATYTNSKFREIEKEVIGMVGVLPTLHQKAGVIATYHVEDEVCVDDFIKEVTQMVYFNEAEVDVKCSCALFEMIGILCRHALAIIRVNKVKNVPQKYILDRWRMDIKRTYTFIRSTYDSVDVRPEVSRYSRILKPHGSDIDRVDTCMNLFGQTIVGTQESVVFEPLQNTTEVLDFGEIQLGDDTYEALDGTEDHGHVQR